MKNVYIFWIAFGILLSLSFYQSIKTANLQNEVEQLSNSKSISNNKEELAVLMLRMQMYMNKLWFAGSNENWELAGFYVHELEEVMEEIEEGEYEEDGYPIYRLIKDWGIKPLEKLEASVEQKDKVLFQEKYNSQILSCNGCHSSVKHQFINITHPTTPFIDNQKY
jgi:hypothetical protein